MRRILVSIGVIILVVILPAGSWYYLQTGLNYRKAALEKLKPKGVFDKSLVTQSDLAKSNTALYQLKDNTVVSDKIYEQYGKAETFVMYTDRGRHNDINWIDLDETSVMNLQKAYPETAFILADTSGQIRHIYNGAPDDVAKEVVSHISMVLPRKKDKDIKMKTTSK